MVYNTQITTYFMHKPLLIKDGLLGEDVTTSICHKSIENRTLKSYSHLFASTNLLYYKQNINKNFSHALPGISLKVNKKNVISGGRVHKRTSQTNPYSPLLTISSKSSIVTPKGGTTPLSGGVKKLRFCKQVFTKHRSLLYQQTSSSCTGTANEACSIDDKVTRTIVITSGKGGVGKTTTTANLGMSIARLGYRVTLIDADIGLRNLDLLLGLENRVLYTAMDIFEGDCRLDQALIRDKRLKNLCLLAISKNRQRYNVTRQKMDSLISSICALGSDFILIDCPAGIDIGFINAISPAQEALIITTPEITAMRDADRVAGLLEANGIYNAKLLINRVRPDMIQRHDMMSVQDVQDVLGIPLLGAIPEDLNVIISTNRGEPLVLSKKLSLSGVAFENAARRLVGKQEYLIDLKAPYKNIFHKMKTLLFNT